MPFAQPDKRKLCPERKQGWLRCIVWSSYIGMPTLCGLTHFFERGEENSQYCV